MFNKKVGLGILMALISSLGSMATDIYTPAMPAVTLDLITTTHMVQLTITVFLIAAGLSQLIYGPLSDYSGRRPILVIGMIIYTIGSIICTFSHSILLLLLGRFIQGIGTGAIWALIRIIIRDAFNGLELVKALSYIGAFIALAPALAPALGGFIQVHLGWRWVFGFLVIISFVLTVISWFFLWETNQNRTSERPSFKAAIHNYGYIIQNGQFWANVVCSGLALAAMIACASINPFLIETEMGRTAGEYGFLAMLSALGFMFGMLTNTAIVSRIGIEKTLKIGNSIIMLMALIFIITGYYNVLSVPVIIGPTMGVSLGIAWVFPNAFMGAITPFSKIAGTAGALYGCIQVGLTFLTSIIVAIMSEKTQLPMGMLLLFTSLIGTLIYQILKHPSWELTDKPHLGAE